MAVIHQWLSGLTDLDQTGSEDPKSPAGDERRMLSHDFGMAGLVKRLVDHAAAGLPSIHRPKGLLDPLQIEWMRVQEGILVLKKPG